MFIIMVYDVNVERVTKVLKIARKYLNWVQNSVLEGELSRAQFERLKSEIEDVINKEEDAIVFYKLRTTAYLQKESMGKKKGEEDIFL